MRASQCPLILLIFFLLLLILQAASVPEDSADAALTELWCRYGLAGCALRVNASAGVVPAPGTWEQGGGAAQPVLAASRPSPMNFEAAAAEVADVGRQQAAETQATAQLAVPSSSAQASQPDTSQMLTEFASHVATPDRHSPFESIKSPHDSLHTGSADWSGTDVPNASSRAAVLAGMAARAAAAGLALASQGAWSALAVTAQLPLWAFLLLGALFVAAAGMQIAIRMRKQALRQRLSDLEAAAVSAVFAPKVVQLRQDEAFIKGNGSVDMEAGVAVQPHVLPAASVPSMEDDAEEDAAGEGEGSAADTTVSPISSGKTAANLMRPAISVDPSVRFRDMSKRAWVHANGAQAHCRSTSGQAFQAQHTFASPLFAGSGSGSSSPASNLASPSIPACSAGLHGSGPAFLATDQGGLAPPFSSSSHMSGCGSQAGPTAGVLQAPGSPGQLRGQALRKLTGARTIQPVDLAGLDLDIEEGQRQGYSPTGDGSACGGSRDMEPDGAALGSSSIEREVLGASHRSQRCSNDTGKRRQLPAVAQPGLRLLTARQFKDQVHMSKLLGVGASGCVYAATWEGQQVAVKMLHPTTVDEGAFAREVAVMEALDHPSIIRVMAACLELPLAVIQELGAGTLHDQLHQRHCRPQYALFMQLAEDVAAALAHCHSQRPPVVHRDLSARNVLLGMDGRARLADFGLAAAKRRTYLSLDKAAALGTAAYMSPEAMQAGQISERTDVYSFGVLLWELLTGREAWEECVSPMQIIFAIAVERRRPNIPSGCPPAIARLLKECWRHNAPLRPSFAEIVSRLNKMRAQSMLLQLQPAASHTPPVSLATKGSAASPYSKAAVASGRFLKPHQSAH